MGPNEPRPRLAESAITSTEMVDDDIEQQQQQQEPEAPVPTVPPMNLPSGSAAGSPSQRSYRERLGSLTPRVAAAAVAKGARKLSTVPIAVGKGIAQSFTDAADMMLEIVDGPDNPVPSTRDAVTDRTKANELYERIVAESKLRRAARSPETQLEA